MNEISLIDSIDTDAVVSTMKKISTLQAVIQQTLKKDHDYGVIPGTNKPTMYKPGGEKICMMFGLTPNYDFMDKTENYKDGFFAYNVRCTLYKNEKAVSQGVGSCNSWEKKYRYINSNTPPEGVAPEDAKSFADKWGNVKYKIDNPDPCDLVNTILKMAKKRAFVDAVLQVASLSEVFTQDLEDMREYLQQEQQASTENMTVEEVEKIVVNFGKHKGKTLGEINESDVGYINWLADKAKDQVMKNAVRKIIDSNQEKKDEKIKVKREVKDTAPKPGTIEDIAKDEDLPF